MICKKFYRAVENCEFPQWEVCLQNVCNWTEEVSLLPVEVRERSMFIHRCLEKSPRLRDSGSIIVYKCK